MYTIVYIQCKAKKVVMFRLSDGNVCATYLQRLSPPPPRNWKAWLVSAACMSQGIFLAGGKQEMFTRGLYNIMC